MHNPWEDKIQFVNQYCPIYFAVNHGRYPIAATILETSVAMLGWKLAPEGQRQVGGPLSRPQARSRAPGVLASIEQ